MAMAITKANILVGNGNAFYAATIPAEGTRVTVEHTTGEPSTGTHIGAISGPTSITYNQELFNSDIEQSTCPIKSVLSAEDFEITGTFNEVDIAHFEALCNGYVTTGSDIMDFGNPLYGAPSGTAVVANAGPTEDDGFIFVAPMETADTFIVVVVYLAYFMNGFSLTIGKTQQSTIPFTVKGHADLARTKGKQIGYIDYSVADTP
jgi:hypothetical protein